MTYAHGNVRWGLTFLVFLLSAVFTSLVAGEDTAKSDAAGGLPLYSEAVTWKDTVSNKDVVFSYEFIDEDDYKAFVSHYYALHDGDLGTFQSKAVDIITSLKPTCNSQLPDASQAWYFFLFPEYKDGQIVYHRALVHTAPMPSSQSTRIIWKDGIRLYDVHLDFDPIVSIWTEAPPVVRTEYSFTPVVNPVIGSIGKALSLVVAGWKSGVSEVKVPSAKEPQGVEAAKLKLRVKATITELTLPYDITRASIAIKDSTTPAKKDAENAGTPSIAVPGASTYYLAPLTYVEIGLGAAFIARTSLNQAATVDSSKNLVDDTPTGLLTYVAANWRPWGYDESDRRPSFRQDFRFVIGPALTPDPGIVLGIGYAPFSSLRPISIQVGYGFLLANVLRSGDTLGKPPLDPAHATKRGGLGVLFIGIGYGLQ